MNKIYNEDCNISLTNHYSYDYIFCIPPDYNELNLDPKTDKDKYNQFLYNIFKNFSPNNNVVTIGVTDRKFKGSILTKHIDIIKIMEDLKYKYLSQKIWCKSYKINLYRLNYSIIMSFGKDKYHQNHNKRYEEDVWNHHVYRHLGYNYAVALEVVKKCILNFTNVNELVYDPFMGSGTTAIACLELNRKYIGSEINKEYFELSLNRIDKYKQEKKTLFS